MFTSLQSRVDVMVVDKITGMVAYADRTHLISEANKSAMRSFKSKAKLWARRTLENASHTICIDKQENKKLKINPICEETICKDAVSYYLNNFDVESSRYVHMHNTTIVDEDEDDDEDEHDFDYEEGFKMSYKYEETMKVAWVHSSKYVVEATIHLDIDCSRDVPCHAYVRFYDVIGIAQ